jgi:hypothetical protein
MHALFLVVEIKRNFLIGRTNVNPDFNNSVQHLGFFKVLGLLPEPQHNLCGQLLMPKT